MKDVIVCTPKSLPAEMLVAAARQAVEINPHNHPPIAAMTRSLPDFILTPDRIAVLTKKYWGMNGVKLTVGFLDNPAADLRKRIILHMNAWNKDANISFVESKVSPQVRIARESGVDGGYWSYLGTDILHIPKKEQTMNLEGFTMNTPDSEFFRVVRHETGHTLGFPHEHMRKALVAKIDERKAISYFMRTQGWSEAEVRAQVLTPLEESSLMGTEANPKCIMCYQLPGIITKDGKPIVGGLDIDKSDFAFAAKIYPKKSVAAKKTTAAKTSPAKSGAKTSAGKPAAGKPGRKR